MNVCIITFRSVTPAQRGEGVLKRAGIPCQLQRTPRQMEEQGCGYGLKIPCHQILKAAEILRTNQIPFRKGYLVREGGRPEEMSL